MKFIDELGTPEELQKILEELEENGAQNEPPMQQYPINMKLPKIPLIFFDDKRNSYKVNIGRSEIIFEERDFKNYKLRFKDTSSFDGFEESILYLPTNISTNDKKQICFDCINGLKYVKLHLSVDVESITTRGSLEILKALPYILVDTMSADIVLSYIMNIMMEALDNEIKDICKAAELKKQKMINPDLDKLFIEYPQFESDFERLLENGIIKQKEDKSFIWPGKDKYLTEYFGMIVNGYPENYDNYKEILWTLIEKVFIKSNLRQTWYNTKNNTTSKNRPSSGFKKIKEILGR